MLKLVPKLNTNKPLKLLTVNMKAHSSILMRLEVEEIAQNKEKCIFFIVVPQFKV